MMALLENLGSNTLNCKVKISVLSCFGDIALAIGPAFEPYLQMKMQVLKQVSVIEPNPVSDHGVLYSPPCIPGGILGEWKFSRGAC